jgi:nitroreductase
MSLDDYITKMNWRYATKKFDTAQKLSAQQAEALQESLRLSPSSFGLQPWKFVVIEKQELKEKLREHSYNQPQITDCSHLFVLCHLKEANETTVQKYIEGIAQTRNVSIESLNSMKQMVLGSIGKRDEKENKQWMKNQTYIALGTLLTACAVNKIDACPIGGFEKEKYDEILELEKEGVESSVVCAVGFRSEEDKYSLAKKVRFPKEELFIQR